MLTSKTMVLLFAGFIGPGLIGCRTAPSPQSYSKFLLAADRSFSRTAEEHGIAQAFKEYAGKDAMVLPQGANPVVGRENIFNLMRDDAGKLTWTPQGADAGRAGDLGYTWGDYQYQPTGTTPIRYGKYVTIWKKQKDGSWKFVVDIGNPSPPPN